MMTVMRGRKDSWRARNDTQSVKTIYVRDSSCVSGPAPAILDWYGHCVRVSVNKVEGSGGMLPQEN